MEAANRYTFNAKNIKKAIRVIRGELAESKAPKWYRRYKAEIKLDKNKLFLDGKEIIPAEKVAQTVRSLLLSKGSKIPWAREAGYSAGIKNKFVGVSRRDFMNVLQSQSHKVRSDPVPPVVKKRGVRVSKRGQLEMDLYHISSSDLPPELARSMKFQIDPLTKNKQSYVLTAVDKLTGLTYSSYLGASKKRPHVMKAVDNKMVPFFAETLKIPPSKISISRDAGGEFAPPSELKGRVVKLGNHIEGRNAFLQRIVFRLIRSKRGGLTSVVQQSMDIANNTKSSIHGFTPLQAVDQSDVVLAERYNKKRAKAGTETRKDLKVGDQVRLVTKKQKGEAFYKSYKQTQWSKELYKITRMGRGANKRYFLGALKKWKHRHELSSPQPENDKETQKILDGLTQYGNPRPKFKGPKKKYVPIKHPIAKRLKERKELTLGERLELAKKRKK
jgi:hypothetical protein